MLEFNVRIIEYVPTSNIDKRHEQQDFSILPTGCTKDGPVPNVYPFWWVGLTMYEGHDNQAGCSKYVLNLNSVPFSPLIAEEVGGCFSDYQTPTYIFIRSKAENFEMKVNFSNFVPGPVNPILFKLPSNCPPIAKGPLSADHSKLGKYRNALAIARKLLAGDFTLKKNWLSITPLKNLNFYKFQFLLYWLWLSLTGSLLLIIRTLYLI